MKNLEERLINNLTTNESLKQQYMQLFNLVKSIKDESQRLKLAKKIGKAPSILVYREAYEILRNELTEEDYREVV